MFTLLRYSLFLAIAGLTSSVHAELKIPTAANYESGRFLCENKFKDLIAFEKGFYTDVPLDYAHPEKGTTPVYAYFTDPFDPNKDTVLYFTGGPGLTGHWRPFRMDVSFNVLVMEQRGIGCSRPDKLEQYLSPPFFSSENVARDAEMLRKKLQIPKWTAYGISYGTAPATIYASLFPQATRSLILEGTLNSGDASLWTGPHRRKLLQKMLDTLPAETKALLKKISVENPIPDIWFSQMARDKLMQNDGLAALKQSLLDLSKPDSYKSLVEQLISTYKPNEFEPNPLFISNDLPYYMISCQELGMTNPELSTSDSLIDGARLVPAKDVESPATCTQLKAKAAKGYLARNYPVSVPVTYFQGSDDSATPAPGAIEHYKTVPRGQAQLLILKRGGHNPNLQMINSENLNQMEIFETAVRGLKIPASLIEKFNETSADLKWVTTSKP